MKIYKTIGGYSSYTGFVKLQGKKRTISFAGGKKKYNIPGRLMTDDPLLQSAVEKHGDYGRMFVLESDSSKEKIHIAPIPVKNVSQGTVTTKEIAEADMIKNNAPPDLPDIQPGISTLKEAKDYLVDKIKGLTYGEIKNSTDAYELSLRHRIEFPNWEKWKEIKEAKK